MTNAIKTWALAALVLTGCYDPFDPASLIDQTRPLAARIEVVGDPGRSTPAAGESATVTWLVEAPGEMPPLSWAFVLCASAGSEPSACAGAPLEVFRGTGQPRFEMAMPAVSSASEPGRLLVLGRICAGSDVMLDEATGTGSCAAGGRGTRAAVDVPLATRTESNRNPTLASRPLWVDDATWAQGADDCGSLPHVVAGTVGHRIRLQTLGEDRETFGATNERESLQVSHFATAGEMDSVYAFVESTDLRDPADLDMKWDAPPVEEVPAEGMVVHFTFVARDLRGGVDWTHRSLCVTR